DQGSDHTENYQDVDRERDVALEHVSERPQCEGALGNGVNSTWALRKSSAVPTVVMDLNSVGQGRVYRAIAIEHGGGRPPQWDPHRCGAPQVAFGRWRAG